MALNINGTTGISGVDGSASAPAVTGTDSNTGINFASDTVNINTGGTTRATVDSNGRLGVGTTPSHPLDIEVASGDAVARVHAAENNNASEARLRLEVSNDFAESIVEAYDSSGIGGSINYNHGDNAWRFLTNNTERMRIDSSGTLFIGKTSQSSGTAGVELYDDGPNFMTRNGTTVLGLNNDAGTNGDIMRFYFQDVHRGNLNFSSGSFSATTASDYRLKENDIPITDGISRVKQLKPIRFNFKDNPSETLDGFFAHELQEVVPDCVTGEKDGEISERGEGYQCISKEGLVPLLTAALKDAIAKIEVLETKVAALEAG